MFDSFGKNDPRKMPSWLFSGAVFLNYATAIKAEVSKQNCSICPRHWYIDAAFQCARCGETFVFSADEQKFWYEELGFWIDSRAKRCAKCRGVLRELKELRQQYDRQVAAAIAKTATLESKQKLLDVLAALETAGAMLPDKVHENSRILAIQVERIRRSGS